MLQEERRMQQLGFVAGERQAYVDVHGVLPKLRMYMSAGENICLVGRAGIGKTSIAIELAGGEENLRTVIGTRADKSELLGGLQLEADRTYWRDGVLVECALNGWVLYIDEIDQLDASCLPVLHSVLDFRKRVLVSGDNREIKVHPKFRFIASCNYSSAGIDPLPRPLRDRMTYVFIQPLSSEREAALLMDRYGLGEADAQWLVSYANATRRADPRNGASTRQLEAAARAILHGVDRLDAAADCILSSIAGSSQSQHESLMNAVRAEGLEVPSGWNQKKTSSDSVIVTEDEEVWS